MCKKYSRQGLPSKKYKELLGSVLCVFNSNNVFIIENILSNDETDEFSWHQLIGKTSGRLHKPVENTIIKKTNTDIADKFKELVDIRNRIMHSFQVTVSKESELFDDIDNKILATKYHNGKQAYITEDFLCDFIKKNDVLDSELHKLRGY